MINNFLIDIDGCIIEGKLHDINLPHLTTLFYEIKQLHSSVHLCTGRSAPYVEAISQLLGIDQWCICENGAYFYHPKTDEVILHPLVTEATISTLTSLKTLFRQQKYKSICKMELGKEVCISLNPINMSIENLFEIIVKDIDRNLLYINHSTTAVDITPKWVDKGCGLRILAKMGGFNLTDVLAIGDSSGDLPFMQLAGVKACPANASDTVKSISDYISPYPTTEGVIDIIQYYSNIND
ncbi:MAG: HAD hydrolase family protein [Gammaproteobacteria bacterium]|nr:HAD hydrolase family protein [Gammaproteobacteria bacterium]MBU1724860.1 HAD hydrolase family protein [Gammaproteobacteria bacterium]MBU2005044.1 HAD hydrolase family protein [Gammaproteobacteria bacterium]